MRQRSILAAVLITFSLLGGPAMAFEQPKFDVGLKDGAFEVRRYRAYVVAEVVVSGDQGQSIQQGFRKLAAYIFGGNQGSSHIAMTAPVAQTPDGEKIAMTSPVSQAPTSPGRWTVQFMMPSRYTLDTLPRANDPDIRFRAIPEREMAVVTFSGVARERAYREKSAMLRKWMSDHGLVAKGDPILAQYDPPLTPWFMRRNEVLIEVSR
jgi:hypothetical protein